MNSRLIRVVGSFILALGSLLLSFAFYLLPCYLSLALDTTPIATKLL